MIELVSLIGASIITALITYFNGIYQTPLDILRIALIFVGSFLGVIALFIIVGFILSAVVNIKKPIKKPSRFYTFIYHMFVGWLDRLFGVRLTVNGEDKLPDTPCLFVMNHRSDFDPIILADKYRKRKILMISKPSNFRIPIAGGVIHKVGYMAIDRENDREALKTVLRAADYLKKGYSIGIYPEGKRNKNGLELLPFRHGAFKIATKADVPIVVTAIHETQNIKKNFPFKRTKVVLDILKTIYPDDYAGKTTVEISDEAAALISADIERFEAEKAATKRA